MRVLIAIAGSALPTTAALAQTFFGLGPAPGTSASIAKDLSLDGTTVVGNAATTNDLNGWRWRQGQGMISLGIPSVVSSVSSDGAAVGGTRVSSGTFTGLIWREDSLTLPSNASGGVPTLSGDGQTLVGTSDENEHAVRWRADTGTVQLPDCNPETFPITFSGNPAFALGVNGDGGVIVGSAFAYVSYPQHQPPVSRVNVPFRWTPSGGTAVIRPGGQVFTGAAYDTSMDGRYVLIEGYMYPQDFGPGRMFRWDALSDSLVEMVGMNQNFSLGGFRLSGDGMAAISGSTMWNDGIGVRPISLVLTQAGCDFTGWTNLFATGIDMNASHLCGYGTNPTGQTEAWYATIPAPGVGGGLLVLGACGAVRRRR